MEFRAVYAPKWVFRRRIPFQSGSQTSDFQLSVKCQHLSGAVFAIYFLYGHFFVLPQFYFIMIKQGMVHTQAGPVHGQLQEKQVSSANSGLLPKLSKVKFYTILCLLSIVFLHTQGRSLMRNSDFPDSPLIKINDVTGLFNLKEGSKVSLTIFDSKFKGYTLSGVVKNHSNMGSNSGVLNIALVGSGVEYKLLVTRKILYNNLVYKIKLIDKKTNTWYTQDGSDKEYYTLSAKVQKHIVTE